MQKLEEISQARSSAGLLPISVIIPVRNEAANLETCLASLEGFGEVFVIDSQSNDATVEIARSHQAKVVQFFYQGGWPKKRQWAMNTLPLSNDWILLMDADEAVPAELESEIREAIQNPELDGYYIPLRMNFLGRRLRHCGAAFRKLSLFRRGKGRFECRLRSQDPSMCDMEVHEHVVVPGRAGSLKNSILHHNVDSLSRYIRKHDEYSNWESHALLQGGELDSLPAKLMGTQAQRRRWLKTRLFRIPGSPILLFAYRYLLRFGFLDGVPGLIYCGFQAVQMFHTKAKIYQLRRGKE